MMNLREDFLPTGHEYLNINLEKEGCPHSNNENKCSLCEQIENDYIDAYNNYC